MLGHQLWRHLGARHEVTVALRRRSATFARYGLFVGSHAIEGFDAMDEASIAATVERARPDAVVNCVGIIKQVAEAKDPIVSLKINSLLPHLLARACQPLGARLVHISTDCVFDGCKGMYVESDPSDATDLYGRSKYLGEIHDSRGITLRTSIIGRELGTANGLIEWFLSQRGRPIKGFRKAVFSGFTTQELSRIIERVIVQHRQLSGLWHVSAEPISKFDLLTLANGAFGADVDIAPEETFAIDRSLDSTRFREATGYRPPSWPEMVRELAADDAFYSNPTSLSDV